MLGRRAAPRRPALRVRLPRILLLFAAALSLAALQRTIATKTDSILIGLVGAGLALLISVPLFTLFWPSNRPAPLR